MHFPKYFLTEKVKHLILLMLFLPFKGISVNRITTSNQPPLSLSYIQSYNNVKNVQYPHLDFAVAVIMLKIILVPWKCLLLALLFRAISDFCCSGGHHQ